MLDRSTDPVTETVDSVGPSLPTLYRHPARKKWGVGLVLDRLADRAHVQFQDGRMRTIHADYLRKLEPVDRPYDVARGLVDALESMAPDDLRGRTRRVDEPVSIDEQAEYFLSLHPGGFADPEFTAEHRGDGRKRPLKRHRDPLLARAERVLAHDALSAAAPSEVHDAFAKLARSTDLVPVKEARALEGIEAEEHARFAEKLVALVHGKAPLEERFDAWVRMLEETLGSVPSWSLATLPLALVEPQRHVVVHPSAFEQQARWMAPGLRCGDRPMGVLYERLRAMARDVFERLGQHDLAPRDLLDVHDFLWLTLKPAARAKIEARRAAATRARPAEETAEAA